MTIIALILLTVVCSRSREEPPSHEGGDPRTTGKSVTSTPTILFLGTSLTAGFGLNSDQAYPSLLQAKIDSAKLRYRAVNAGVSGETSAEALRRIDGLLQTRPAVVVIETGANDGLRRQDPSLLRTNIQAIIDRLRAISPPPRIVLVGMEALPYQESDYGWRFRKVYLDLAQANGISLVPDLLAGVAGVGSLNQPDGIHPTAAGQQRLAENVWQTLGPVLSSAQPRR